MQLRVGRIFIAAIVAEIIGVLALIILVMIFGPSDQRLAQEFAEKLGAWVGPISGFVLCVIGGYWVASGSENPVLNGSCMGTAGAILDISIAVIIGGAFAPILVASNLGRILGGTLGGVLAANRPAA